MTSKAKLRRWPWNNTPSRRHKWKYVGHSEKGGRTDRCLRCGSFFIEKADAHGPVYCYPTPDWLKAHPEDDGKAGP